MSAKASKRTLAGTPASRPATTASTSAFVSQEIPSRTSSDGERRPRSEEEASGFELTPPAYADSASAPSEARVRQVQTGEADRPDDMVVVAGGASGLGLGLAEILSREAQLDVVLTGRSQSATAAAARSVGARGAILDLGSLASGRGFARKRCERLA